ncbi:MAG TPA: hypothetical protein DCK85_05790, partial [Ktedonobacter sp.]|nr:hypothetical protein [Ktedonobacter sp.]
MSNDQALPSQDDSQRQKQRLNFQPFNEAPEEQDRAMQDDATLVVPVSTPEQTHRSKEWLVATTTLPTQEQIQMELSPLGRELQNMSAFVSQFPPKRPRIKKTPLPFETECEQSEGPYSIAMVKAEQREQFQHPTSARQHVALLETLQHSIPDDLETSRIAAVDDDPEFEKLRTIPMMVLTNIAKKQGTEQLEMKSEVSGAAGAAGIVGFGNIVGSILKYVSTFLIQYGFGAGGYGLYTLCLSLVNLVSAVFNLGLDDAMVRYVAIYRGRQQTKSLQGLLLFCTALAGIAGILGAVLLLLFTTQLVTLWISLKHHTHDNEVSLTRAIALLQVMAPVIPLMTMQVMWFAGLRGFRAFKWRVLSTGILQPLLQILLLVVVLLLFRSKDGITAVALVLLISTMFSTILNM